MLSSIKVDLAKVTSRCKKLTTQVIILSLSVLFGIWKHSLQIFEILILK